MSQSQVLTFRYAAALAFTYGDDSGLQAIMKHRKVGILRTCNRLDRTHLFTHNNGSGALAGGTHVAKETHPNEKREEAGINLTLDRKGSGPQCYQELGNPGCYLPQFAAR